MVNQLLTTRNWEIEYYIDYLLFPKMLSEENILIRKTLFLFLLILSSLFMLSTDVRADNSQPNLPEILIETDSPSPAGQIIMRGSSKKEVIDGVNVYFCDNEESSLSYKPNSTYFPSNDSEWHIASWKEKKFDGITLNKNIGTGVLYFECSYDGHKWYEDFYECNLFVVQDPWDNFARFQISDINLALFVRIRIAYKLERTKQVIPAHWEGIIYKPKKVVKEEKYVSDIYKFRLGKSSDSVSIYDVSNYSLLQNNSKTPYGFYVQKNWSDSEVSVKRESNAPYTIDEKQTVNEKGKYRITVKNVFGKEFVYNVEITEGLTYKELSPQVFSGDYDEENKVSGNTVFGKKSLTKLRIAQNTESNFTEGTHYGYTAYGVYGSTFKLFLNLWDNYYDSSNDWDIVSDKWGKKDKQTIDGIPTNMISTGALIIQTSKDGKKWYKANKSKYAQGLYTTDFFNYYGDRGDIEICTPSGEDINNGLFIRVFYAYQVQKDKKKTRYLEKYEFFVCNDNLGAITIHNLSLKENEIKEVFGDADDQTIEIGIHAETLTDGSETVTGFRIDSSLNQMPVIKVNRNGSPIDMPQNKTFTDSGKYEITIESAVNNATDCRVIYVDTEDIETVKKRYFGNGFIKESKRIYAEGLYPVYEGGKTEWNIMEVDINYLPIQGVIKNKTTGEIVEKIEATRTAKSGKLSSPGEYEVILYTNPEYDINEKSGDIRKFTFHFRIIEEGTAPGPVVNKKILTDSSHWCLSDGATEFSKLTSADYYPVYYGLIYDSAADGDIQLMFSNYDDARNYAYEHAQGKVESQEDGSYRYNGELRVDQKELYESAWEVTELMNNVADKSVKECFIDRSDRFTCTEIPKELEMADNLKRYEFNRTVIACAEGQEDSLKINDESLLPIINDKHYYIQYPNVIKKDVKVADGDFVEMNSSFKFVRDKYGCDSYSVCIFDSDNTEYQIEYEKDVEEQLRNQGCPSGIVTIKESTVYGDAVSYEAVYIAEGENLSEVTIEYYINGDRFEKTINQNSDKTDIRVNAFGILSLKDKTDPYNLIIVTMPDGKTKQPYVADKVVKDLWTDAGIYNIKIVNRLGYEYHFNIEVSETDLSTVTFSGDGTEELKDLLVVKGQHDVELPKPEKYGYDFIKYVDSAGKEYVDVIDLVDYDGKLELTSLLAPKNIKVTLLNSDGSVMKEMLTSFGDEIELPLPEIEDEEEFVCWERKDNGERLSLDYVVDSENDQVLCPVINYVTTDESNDYVKGNNQNIIDDTVESDKTRPNDIANKSKPDTKFTVNGFIIIVFVLSFIVGIILVVLLVKTAAKKEENR